jgi:hypothetical protein
MIAKETITRVKRTYRIKLLNYTSDKVNIQTIKKLQKLKSTFFANSILKMGSRHLSKEYIQMVNRNIKKVLNITRHQGNANQNHNRISPHSSKNGHYPKAQRS